ncbi:hypothetical protein D9M68_304110 [compost metagenome]
MKERDAAALADGAQFGAHPGAQIGVERAERLVEQYHARFGDQRPRQRDALPLATGDLCDGAAFQTA